MRIVAALAAALLALAAGVPAALFAQTGTTTQTGGASTKWQAPVPDIDALTCTATQPRLYQIRLDTGDGMIYYCDGTVWQPLGGGGGAATLDDLTDVATAGAAPGEALTYTGTGWAPSAAAVIQEGDARLTDARAPTFHADSHEAGGADAVELALDDLTDVDATGPSSGDLLVFSDPLWTYGVPQLEDLSGTLPPDKGGTGLDTSASTGVPSITAGTWSVGDVALGSQTSGGYAASVSEGGPATTATALAANGADCAAGQWAAGVDASGAAEGCTPDATLSGAAAGGDLAGTYPDPTIAADAVGLDQLAACPGPDEIVEYGASGVPSCIATPSGGGIGGSTGANDNRLLRSDGTGGATLQSSALTVLDDDATYGPRIESPTGGLSGGNMTLRVGATGSLFRFTSGASDQQLLVASENSLDVYTTGTRTVMIGWPAIQFRSDQAISWANTTNPTGGKDTGIKRCAAGVACATNGSSGAGSISALMAQLVPQASAPTCPTGNAGLYFDSSGSGALCACPPGGAWAMIHDFGSGNCT